MEVLELNNYFSCLGFSNLGHSLVLRDIVHMAIKTPSINKQNKYSTNS
jgi:hypothetical protein